MFQIIKKIDTKYKNRYMDTKMQFLSDDFL